MQVNDVVRDSVDGRRLIKLPRTMEEELEASPWVFVGEAASNVFSKR